MTSRRFILLALAAAGCARTSTPAARPTVGAEPLRLCERFECVPASSKTDGEQAPVRVDINLSSPALRRAPHAG